MRLTSDMREALRRSVQNRNDADIAEMFRERNTDEVSHLSDADLLTEIGTARQKAVELGIRDTKLRMRFIMLGVFRLPHFWQDPTITAMLTAKTGTPDMRFGDVCSMFKRAAERAGNPDQVWW